MPAPDTSRISPTAHYTSYVWYRNGLSHPALATAAGRALYAGTRIVDRVSSAVGGPTVEAMLLARHRLIDLVLERAIASGRIGQVVEVAGGLSYRGTRMTRRFPELVYLDGDLPGMSARKRELLSRADAPAPGHAIVSLNALADSGPDSLAGVVAGRLDPGVGTAIVTEGLIPYFDARTVDAMWRRFAAALRGFAAGLYVSDLYTRDTIGRVPGSRAALLGIAAIARGSLHLHFDDAGGAEAAARAAGFDRCEVVDRRELDVPRIGRGAGLARVLSAWIEPAGARAESPLH